MCTAICIISYVGSAEKPIAGHMGRSHGERKDSASALLVGLVPRLSVSQGLVSKGEVCRGVKGSVKGRSLCVELLAPRG